MIIESKLTRDVGRYSQGVAATDSFIKNEPMLWSCSFEFALVNGGPLTLAFLSDLGRRNENPIIDSRVHMLMPGMYPCIPGWHHDDVERNTPDGQPNYVSATYRPRHAAMLFGAEVCPTEFATGTIDLPEPGPGQRVYEVWHPLVQEAVQAGRLQSVHAEDRVMYFFDDRTFHQGTPAVKQGWRFFIRATMGSRREFKNEVRKQVQVYLANPFQGW